MTANIHRSASFTGIRLVAVLFSFWVCAIPSSAEDSGPWAYHGTLKISSVSPLLIRDGDRVRIFFSRDILDAEASSPTATDTRSIDKQVRDNVSVEIGRMAAPIVEASKDAVLVEVRGAGLPLDEKLPITAIVKGARISAATDQYVEIRSTSAWVYFVQLPLAKQLIYGAVAGLAILLGGAFLVFFLGYLRREKKLIAQVDELKFQIERPSESTAKPPARSGETAAKPGGPQAAAPEAPVPADLVSAIVHGECALFWGAGLSAQVGYPTWAEGIRALVDGLESELDLQSDLKRILQTERRALALDIMLARLGRENLVRRLKAVWGHSKTPSRALTRLGQITFTNAITPAWDPLIDAVFEGRSPSSVLGVTSGNLDPLLSMEKFCIVRLWGSLDSPDSAVFSSGDYRSAAAANPIYGNYLATLALTQTHLFIGASYETIEEYFSAAPRGAGKGRKHYALVARGSEDEQLMREVFAAKYGVELLPFSPTPGWPQVPSFVERLARDVDDARKLQPARSLQELVVTSVKLKNIGMLASLDITFDKSWNLLLGNNSSGKSTVLRAIAYVLAGKEAWSLAEAGRLLTSGTNQGFIELFVGADEYRMEFTRDSDGRVQINPGSRLSPLQTGRCLVMAFPPLRGIPVANPAGPSAGTSDRPLVEDVIPVLTGTMDARLGSLKQWLVNLAVRSVQGEGITAADAEAAQRTRDSFFAVLNEFIPGANVQFSSVNRATWEVNIVANGRVVSIDQVSQGTSSILGWVGALLQRMYEVYGAEIDPRTKSAVVLIDEIDAHLHPEWQQRIVHSLKEQFPKVQFIATTHSPFVVCELEKEQVFRLRNKEGVVEASNPPYPIQGLGIAGVLVSDLFDLKYLVDSDTEKLLEEQRRLSAKDALDTDDLGRMKELNAMLERLGFRHQVRDVEYTKYLKQARISSPAPGAGPTRQPSAGTRALAKALMEEAAAKSHGNSGTGGTE